MKWEIGVKKPSKSNMFSETKAAELAVFADVIDGSMDAHACVVSYGAPSQEVRTALEAAMKALGYDTVFVNCAGRFEVDGGDRELFACLEGIDPRVVVIADELACALVSKAFRENIVLDQKSRAMGRNVVAFTSFEADLKSPVTKQRDWALMKALRS